MHEVSGKKCLHSFVLMLNTQTAKFCIFLCYYTTTESRPHGIGTNRKKLLVLFPRWKGISGKKLGFW